MAIYIWGCSVAMPVWFGAGSKSSPGVATAFHAESSETSFMICLDVAYETDRAIVLCLVGSCKLLSVSANTAASQTILPHFPVHEQSRSHTDSYEHNNAIFDDHDNEEPIFGPNLPLNVKIEPKARYTNQQQQRQKHRKSNAIKIHHSLQ